jgi:hypothetical protein
MKKILKKDQVISALIEARQNILREVSDLSDEHQDRVFLGIWSVRDLLAHLTGWDYTNIDAIQEVMAGRLPSFYDHHDRDWQTYNAMLVKQYKRGSFNDQIASVRDSQHKLIEFLETIPPEDFNKDFGVRFRGYKVTVQRLMEADIKDVQIHCKQITDFFGETK